MVISKHTKMSIGGDFHLNLRDSSLEDWERDRFLSIFDEFANNDSTLIVLNGDIFDKAKPTLQEIGVFYEGLDILAKSGKDVLLIEGNHEELGGTNTTYDHLPHTNFTRIKVDYLETSNFYIWMVGHPYISSITDGTLPIMHDKDNLLISHYRSDIGVAKEEIDNSIVSDMFVDTILSDVHYRLHPTDNIQYTSSPYNIHYTPQHDTGYITIEFKDDSYSILFHKLSLPSKYKVATKLEKLEDTLKQLVPIHRYNLEVVGTSSSEALQLISDYPNVVKFSFTERDDAAMLDDLTDKLEEMSNTSLEEMIMTSLETFELTEKERELARTFITEEL